MKRLTSLVFLGGCVSTTYSEIDYEAEIEKYFFEPCIYILVEEQAWGPRDMSTEEYLEQNPAQAWEALRAYERGRAKSIVKILPKVQGKPMRERMGIYGQELVDNCEAA